MHVAIQELLISALIERQNLPMGSEGSAFYYLRPLAGQALPVLLTGTGCVVVCSAAT